MTSKESKFIIFVIIISVAVFFAKEIFNASDFPYGKPRGFSLNETPIKDPLGDSKLYEIKSGTLIGTIKIIPVENQEAGNNLVETILLGFKNTLKPVRIPYSGQISKIIDCESNKSIKWEKIQFNKNETIAILALSNARFVWSGCSIEQVKYTSLLWSAYDHNKKNVLVIKIFKELTNFKDRKEYNDELISILKYIINIKS